MNAGVVEETRRRLGADRVLAPPNVLPQPAQQLDPSGPVRPFEFELAVDRLCLDSTSFRNVRERAAADPALMAERILEIVASRGKMHNPETDSGGVAVGTVSAIGERISGAPTVGARVVSLASLTLTPLRLERIVALDPDSAQIEVDGHAYVCERAAWNHLPEDLPLDRALELLDVYAAGSHTRDLAPRDGTICVLGAGHAGKLALAAARDVMEGGTVVAVDIEAAVVEDLAELGLCDIAVCTDLRDPLAALEACRAAGAPPADLTVVVVNAGGCEPTAVLLTADSGAVLFFSMATNFQTAALSSDGMGSGARLLIGSGYAPDVGDYALDLARRSPALRKALGIEAPAVARQ